jgi:glycerol-3-phosphate dehydrogenase (NAD(P)+)
VAETITIIGDGGWGTALALLVFENGHDARIWSKFPSYAAEVAASRENVKFLPGFPIPLGILVTSDAGAALAGATLVVVAVPTQFIRDTLTGIKPHFAANRVVSVAKGLEKGTLSRPSEIIASVTAPERIAVLAGPSHAEEVARGLPASVVSASKDLAFAREVQAVFSNQRFRAYANTDPLGVELCGAVKNIIAIAAGISDALGFGDNAKAALLTRGLVEIVRLGSRLGAASDTFYGLAGLGDLITTSVSPYGRNRHVGMEIGSGKKLKDVLAHMEQVAEGVETTKAVLELAKRLGVEMPITAEVYRILFENKDPRQAVVDLMVRSLKDESPRARSEKP